MFESTQASSESSDSQWISLSDMMAGLMMVFLCIAVFVMRSLIDERAKIRELAESYRDTQLAIYQTLQQEFAHDLTRWGASLDKQTLAISFNNSDALFKTGDFTLSDNAREIMSSFVPRYIEALTPYMDSIAAIQIEGHTSSEWGDQSAPEAGYFHNLRLSQQRSRAVMQYAHSLLPSQQAVLVRAKVAAVGYSSARPVLDENGVEDPDRSRRVAFRVVRDSESHILQILEEAL
ncbi:flagellar motor protein MotB [Microbulbifer sp. ZKSA004]|uniref:OmpA/MotB family protein n=1 Tax=Microbulbifer sp. ZKSA004 TaxID=3243389 RepID=UPI00403A20DD